MAASTTTVVAVTCLKGRHKRKSKPKLRSKGLGLDYGGIQQLPLGAAASLTLFRSLGPATAGAIPDRLHSLAPAGVELFQHLAVSRVLRRAR